MPTLTHLLFSVLLVTFFVSLTNGDVNLRVSHQVSRRPDIAIDVRVDDESIEEFNDLVYSETSSYATFPDQEQYLMSIYLNGTNLLLFNWTCELTPNTTSSFFVVENPHFEFEGLVYANQEEYPSQYFFNYRLINLATTRNVVSALVDDQFVDNLGFDQESFIQTLGAAVYVFSLLNSTDQSNLLSTEVALAGGYDYTVLINFVGGTTEYMFMLLVDGGWTYGNCEIRGVNAVPNGDVMTLRIVQEATLFFEDYLDYSEISGYASLVRGAYTAIFSNTSNSVLAIRPFICESSGRHTLIFFGDDEIGEDVSAGMTFDSIWAPLYTQSAVRIFLASPSPSASPAEIILQGEDMGEVLYPSHSQYLPTTSQSVSLVLEANGQTLLNSTLNLQFGTCFTLFVFGLAAADQTSDDYPIISSLVVDFQALTPATTTTTTTTGSTTGTIIDDFDDGGGLSGGPIAGIVVGIIVVFVVFGGLVCFLKKRRKVQLDPGYVQFQQAL